MGATCTAARWVRGVARAAYCSWSSLSRVACSFSSLCIRPASSILVVTTPMNRDIITRAESTVYGTKRNHAYVYAIAKGWSVGNDSYPSARLSQNCACSPGCEYGYARQPYL